VMACLWSGEGKMHCCELASFFKRCGRLSSRSFQSS
jgi:hypothetical protein